MNDKSILDILDILEQIVNTCTLLSKEVYSSLDYSNSTIDICADKFQELELKIWELQKEMIETASPDAFKKIHAFIMQENGQVIGIVSNDLPFQVGDTIQNQDNGIDYVVTDVKKVLIVRPVTGLDTVLQKSFLKEPVEQGIKIFEYSNGTFYFEVAGKKQEAIFWANEKEVMKLIKDVCKLYGKQFDSLHPVAIINDDRLKFVAVTKPASNNLYMYLDLNYPESNAQI